MNASLPLPRLLRPLLVAAALAALWLAQPERSVAIPVPESVAFAGCDPDVTQPSGAIHRFCLPAGWEAGGALLVYAHGYVWFNEPLAIPESHICFGEPGQQSCVNELVNDFGIAFATTSYPTNGLAVLPAVEDVASVVAHFAQRYGAPGTVLLAGVSEGGLVTTLAVERHPELFDGGLAACGPIGSWQAQLAYLGDFRLLFHYFFPEISPFPSDTLAIPPGLIEAWGSDYFDQQLAPALFDPANEGRLRQLLATSQIAHSPGDTATIRLALYDALAYNIMATNEVTEKLGGNPFDNIGRLYRGSDDDEALNAAIPRWAAAPAALAAMQPYETTGQLARPLVTLHTSRDQQVPAWHETQYHAKTRAMHRWMWHVDQPVPVDAFGHCRFDVQRELLPAFFRLLGMVADPPQPTILYLPIIG